MSSITIFIFTFGLIVSILPNEIKSEEPNNRIIYRTCTKEENVTPKQLREAMRNNSTSVPENVQCYIKCIDSKQGLISENEVNEEAITKLVLSKNPDADKTILGEKITECKEKFDGASFCEKAYNFHRCFFSGSPRNKFRPQKNKD